MQYPLEITLDPFGYLVTCPDLPEIATAGDDLASAMANGAGAVAGALAARLIERKPIPSPSNGDVVARVPSLLGLKVMLSRELTAQGVTIGDLARALKWDSTKAKHLFDPKHATPIEQFDAAFDALGKRIEIWAV